MPLFWSQKGKEGRERSKVQMFSALFSDGVCVCMCVDLSTTHRFAFTTCCCTQHFLLNTHLGLSHAHQCKVPDQTRQFSCKIIRKAESILSSKSGNSYMLIVCSPSLIPQKSPHKLNRSTTTLAGDKLSCVVWQRRARNNLCIYSKRPGSSGKDGHAGPRHSEAAVHSPITNLTLSREKRENCCVLYSIELNEGCPSVCAGYSPLVYRQATPWQHIQQFKKSHKCSSLYSLCLLKRASSSISYP